MAKSRMSLKLLVDTDRNKVIFAEAGKELVDYLFDILNLNVGTVFRVLQAEQDELTVCCLQNLYQSIENLNETCLEPGVTKVNLFEPAVAGKRGFVNGVVTYMVTDDLKVEPMSAVSILTLLNHFDIKEVCVLKGKMVEMGMDEAMNLLKSSLTSKNVLTEVFLGNK